MEADIKRKEKVKENKEDTKGSWSSLNKSTWKNEVINKQECCNNHLSQWQMTAPMSKSLRSDIIWEFHKRTWQGVSAKLESYIYKVHMVHATNNYACPYVYTTTLCLPYSLLKATILYTCALTSSF